MVREDRECDEVLTQIAAVKAALDQTAKLILHEHMRTCVQAAVKQGRGDKALRDLETAINRFIR
jgi:DNA-binding FrmR family transcriptional regulator